MTEVARIIHYLIESEQHHSDQACKRVRNIRRHKVISVQFSQRRTLDLFRSSSSALRVYQDMMYMRNVYIFACLTLRLFVISIWNFVRNHLRSVELRQPTHLYIKSDRKVHVRSAILRKQYQEDRQIVPKISRNHRQTFSSKSSATRLHTK